MTTTTPYKRFLVFAYGYYYPSGGAGDAEASFDTLEEAFAYAESDASMRWNGHYDILDLQERVWVVKD